jgi:Tfp pilus assembly PilM family ATPase
MGGECPLLAIALRVIIIRTISACKDDIDRLEIEIVVLGEVADLSPIPMKGDECAKGKEVK